MNWLSRILKSWWEWWDKFFFQSEELYSLAVMRILFGANLFYIYFIRGLYNLEFYKPGGLVARDKAIDIIPQFYQPNFSMILWPDSMAVWVHGVFVGLLLLMTLGLSNRLLMFVSWVIHLGFIQRNYAVLFGADMISAIFLFYLSFTRANQVLSARSILARWLPKISQRECSDYSKFLSSLFFRILQIQLAIIYAYTGFEKLKGITWWDGTALWSVLANPQMTVFDMTFLRHLPGAISLLAFLTIIFEIYWPVMICFRQTRWWWLLLGLGFHLSIGLFMSLWNFSFVMLSLYVLFIPSQSWEKWMLRFKQKFLSF